MKGKRTMTRINVYGVQQHQYLSPCDEDCDCPRDLVGWFNPDKATEIREDTEWDGNNHISVATGSQWDHEFLYRTAQGRWVLNTWSQRQGVTETYRFISDDTAREWLLTNHRDEETAKFFGPVEEERGPGRPEVGGPIHVRLGDDLLGQVDLYAKVIGRNRAEAIRILLGSALAK